MTFTQQEIDNDLLECLTLLNKRYMLYKTYAIRKLRLDKLLKPASALDQLLHAPNEMYNTYKKSSDRDAFNESIKDTSPISVRFESLVTKYGSKFKYLTADSLKDYYGSYEPTDMNIKAVDLAAKYNLLSYVKAKYKGAYNDLIKELVPETVRQKPTVSSPQVTVAKMEKELARDIKHRAKLEALDVTNPDVKANIEILKQNLKEKIVGLGLKIGEAKQAALKQGKPAVSTAGTKNSRDPEAVNKIVKAAVEKTNGVNGVVGSKPELNVKKKAFGAEATSASKVGSGLDQAARKLEKKVQAKGAPLPNIKTTNNLYSGASPLAQLVSSPTQLLKTDFTDARLYEAVMPFFSGSKVPAYIKLMDDDPTNPSFSETINEDLVESVLNKAAPSIDNPFENGARYNQFSIQSFGESHNEKFQITDSNGFGHSVFGFDEKVEVWSITGIVINDRYNNWLAKLREVWDKHLRLSMLIEHQKYARFVIPSQRIAFNGYPIGLTINHGESMEMAPSFSMSIIIREWENFLTFGFTQNSAAEVLIKNLMYLDGVVV